MLMGADQNPPASSGPSRLGLGCWPLAGMTRTGVTREEAVATVAAALDSGITHLDTAYCYGEQGESERAICTALRGHPRERVFLAGKCGIHWAPGRRQTVDGSPARLTREADESLRRLGTDHLDLLYLHAPDPATPIEDSAAALAELQ
jgi:aryl-alcohol dehydrogenase-like predicted oxidoreductase